MVLTKNLKKFLVKIRVLNIPEMEDKGLPNRNPSPSFARIGDGKLMPDDIGRNDVELNQVLQTGNEDAEYEELDPRVQEELEKLNLCTDKINEFELQLEEANAVFRTLLTGKI